MQETQLRFKKTDVSLTVAEVRTNAEGWLLDCEIRQHSRATLATRRIVLDKLTWFLKQYEYPTCGVMELRRFLAHLTKGHEEPGGRWGATADPSRHPAQAKQQRKPVRPRTVHTYHGHLRTFFRWMVAEGVIPESPMEAIAAPVARTDQIQPFSEEEVSSLLAAARRSSHPRRDEAIVLLLYDTGMRASECCSLKMSDVDMQGRRCSVMGKGRKQRTCFFGGKAAKALWSYLREDERPDSDAPVFLSDRGTGAGEPLTRSGLFQLIRKLGRVARIEAKRCSPHTLRHSFAVTFLRGGGNVFTLKELLGHSSLAIVNRYVALAQADLEAQHRAFSPADRLKGGRRG